MDTVLAAEVIAKRTAEAIVLQPVASELRELSVTAELTYCDPTSNSALRFDLDGRTALGRLTWWTDGSLFVEALRNSDGATLVSQHAAGATAADASHALRVLAGVVAGLPSNNSFKPNPLRGSA
jgi:hypothetical protein